MQDDDNHKAGSEKAFIFFTVSDVNRSFPVIRGYYA